MGLSNNLSTIRKAFSSQATRCLMACSNSSFLKKKKKSLHYDVIFTGWILRDYSFKLETQKHGSNFVAAAGEDTTQVKYTYITRGL